MMADQEISIALSYQAWRGGSRIAGEALYRLAFRRLRGIAASLLGFEREGHTLQPTALVHECFLKLCGGSAASIESDEHFFRIAARAMKQALVDHGRVKTAGKRVAPRTVPQLYRSYKPVDPSPRLDTRLALGKLKDFDAVAERTFRLRCVEGMTIEEAAKAQGLKPARVRENYDFAVVWLARKLGGAR